MTADRPGRSGVTHPLPKQPCFPPSDLPPRLSGRPSSSEARDSLVSSLLVASKLEAFNRWPRQTELRPRVHSLKFSA